jgi:hypothetical protein
MELSKKFAYGICSFALASAAWAGGGLHSQSSSAGSSAPSESVSSEMSTDSSLGHSSQSMNERFPSSSTEGASQPELLSGDPLPESPSSGSSSASTDSQSVDSSTYSEQYSAMDDSFWDSANNEEIPLGG